MASAPDRDELGRIHAALAPRGPDGEGLWSSPDGRLLLAHRRLAILDLSPAGAQPMSSADGRFTLVFNGEIYNFRELAAELAAQGAHLRSRSDTEVVLELWRREGPRALAKLRGMFALAIWDNLAGAMQGNNDDSLVGRFVHLDTVFVVNAGRGAGAVLRAP